MSDIVTLTRKKEYNRAYAKGKSFVSDLLVIYILKNRNNGIRLGITTSKKIGNAVQRNRARRVIKESFRHILPRLNGNFDIVFVARKKTPFVKSTYVEKQMVYGFNKLNLFGAYIRK